jgi:ubiquinone/menaquinone biosynthesis C-methylase UbiE
MSVYVGIDVHRKRSQVAVLLRADLLPEAWIAPLETSSRRCGRSGSNGRSGRARRPRMARQTQSCFRSSRPGLLIHLAGCDRRLNEGDYRMTTSTSDNSFTHVDDASEEMQRQLIGYLDTVATHPEIQRVRTAAFEIFAPGEGERLLDAGCGLGEVARQFGARVGTSGSVTAVDRSQQTVAVAESRDAGGLVTYAAGDVTALDFPDGSFDGVRCERVLQHVPNPDSAVRELARVTRPGGRVCVIDADWSSSVWDGFEYMDEVISAFFPDGNSSATGRAVRSHMVRAGLRETSVLPVTLRFTSPADAGVVTPFFIRSVVRDRVPTKLFNQFFASVDQSANRGDFLFAFTMWICLGRVALA